MSKIFSDGFEFKFRNFSEDYDNLLEHHVKNVETKAEKRAFMEFGWDFVQEAYYAQGRYAGIVNELISDDLFFREWRECTRYDRCIKTLIKLGKRDLLKRLIRSAAMYRLRTYWIYKRYKSDDDGADYVRNMEEHKRLALEDLDYAIRLFHDLDEGAEQARFEEEKSLLLAGKRRRVTSKPDPRKMDEDLFWEVVAAGAAHDTVPEKVDAITAELARFGGRAIQGFRKIFEQKMAAAYRWDVWALAYIAQEGCSDDSFEYFRAWLILQGRDVFEPTLSDVASMLDAIPGGLSTQAESFLFAADEAYQLRTGKGLKPPKSQQPEEPAGTRWEEESVEELYPAVSAHYASA